MELADPRIVQELLAAHYKISRGRPAHNKHPRLTGVSMASSRKTRRCHCGQCQRCLEDARWERIFNERFADPDYYKARPTHFGSSLGWLGRAAS